MNVCVHVCTSLKTEGQAARCDCKANPAQAEEPKQDIELVGNIRPSATGHYGFPWIVVIAPLTAIAIFGALRGRPQSRCGLRRLLVVLLVF